MLDDIGKEKRSEWVEQVWFQVVDERYREARQMIFTSNHSLDELRGRVGEATVDRIREVCNIARLAGRSRR